MTAWISGKIRLAPRVSPQPRLTMSQSPPPPSAPVALTIAGSDSGANAGLQADLLSFAANGVYGVCSITCITAQNPLSISSIQALPPELVEEQARQVAKYYQIRAAKTGMLFNLRIIEAVASFFRSHTDIELVVDPVMVSSSGKALLQDEAIAAIKDKLLPLAEVITPNLDEAEILYRKPIKDLATMKAAAAEMAQAYQSHVVLKGGHLPGDDLFDVVASPEGRIETYRQSRIHEIDTHGSGCTLSAAIAAQLAKGQSTFAAIEAARAYLRRGMERPLTLHGKTFINHFPDQ